MGMADGLSFEYQEKRIQDGKDEAKRTKARKAKLLRLITEYGHGMPKDGTRHTLSIAGKRRVRLYAEIKRIVAAL